MPRVLIGSRSFGQRFPEHLAELERAGLEVIPNRIGRAYRAPELREALDGVEAIVTGTDELTGEVIRGARSLRAIVKHGVGLENVDLAAAAERGVAVSSTPGAMDDSVADLALGLLLALARSIVRGHEATRAGGWPRLEGFELRGRLLGLVGFGRIAEAVRARAAAFGMRAVASDPHPDAEERARRAGIRLVELPELLREADVVSLHAALPAGAPPLLGAAELALLKPDALLLNTARGALVDEAALADALAAGRLGGAALDVFAQEPPAGSPLLALENVVLTPHLGGQTVDALRRMGELTVRNCLLALGADA